MAVLLLFHVLYAICARAGTSVLRESNGGINPTDSRIYTAQPIRNIPTFVV